MISRATDYQTITPVGIINGGILPARDGAHDGSSRTLRAEDLCFAIEAARERDLYGWFPSSGWPSPSLVLRMSDWQTTWFRLREVNYDDSGYSSNLRPRAIAYGETFANIPFTHYTVMQSALDVLFPQAYAPSCHASITDSGRVLNETSMWRGFYYDLLRADRLRVTQSYSGTYTTIGDTGSDTYTYTVSGMSLNPFSNNSRLIQQITYPSGTRSRQFGVVSANLSTTVPLPNLVTSAKLVAVYTLRVQDQPAMAPSVDYYFTRSANVSVTGTTISVPQSLLLAEPDFDLLDACSDVGHPLPSSTSGASLWFNTGATVWCEATYLILEYAFRTEIRSLNWQWTP